MKLSKKFIIFATIASVCSILLFKHIVSFYENEKGNLQPRASEVHVRHVTKHKHHWPSVQMLNGQKHDMPSSPRVILLWTSFFGKRNFIPNLNTSGCPKPECIVTSNRSMLSSSDAVIFHLRDLNIEDMPSSKLPWQRWVLLHHESPPHTPSILKPLNGLMNWTATYREDSDIILSPQVIQRQNSLPSNQHNFAANKTRMVVWFVSNCQTPSNREGFVKELRKSVSVDIYGSCGDKKCMPKMSKDCYKRVSKEYRFYLSFENSLCKDYVTEKFFHILDTDMVPVVFGGADYSKAAPPKSYIDALAFSSPRQLAFYLLSVAKDDAKYNSYFDWRQKYVMSTEHYSCALCKKLHDPNSPPSTYKNLHKWWFDEAKCQTWSTKTV